MENLASQKQLNMMYALFARMGLSECGIAFRKQSICAKYGITSTLRLTKWDMVDVIDGLLSEIEELERSKKKLF